NCWRVRWAVLPERPTKLTRRGRARKPLPRVQSRKPRGPISRAAVPDVGRILKSAGIPSGRRGGDRQGAGNTQSAGQTRSGKDKEWVCRFCPVLAFLAVSLSSRRRSPEERSWTGGAGQQVVTRHRPADDLRRNRNPEGTR